MDAETDPLSDSSVMWAVFDDALEPDGFNIEGYEILGELERGGMGIVYHARQLIPEREVALKVMLPKYTGDVDMRERFQTEARAMAALDHPGILPIYEVGEVNEIPYFSMKLASGGSMADLLKKGDLDRRLAVSYLIDICAAVHFAHQRGVLHRDLKPGNFLFDDKGKVYVGDFGVAKMLLHDDMSLTQTQSFVGTPNYMPPENTSRPNVSATTAGDQYSLGAVLYECLTGKRPYSDHSNVVTLIKSISTEEIPRARSVRADIPLDLEVICSRSLDREPNRRYSSIETFREDLVRWQEGRPIFARPISGLEKVYRWSLRHPLPAALTAALVLLTCVGIFLQIRSNHETRLRLYDSLVNASRSERLAGRPGHREKIFKLLTEARELKANEVLREEAIATLAKMDIVEIDSDENHFDPPVSTEWSLLIDEFGNESILVSGEARTLSVRKLTAFFVISPDRRTAAVGGPYGLEIFDRDSGESLWMIESGAVRCQPAWSADGRFLALSIGESKGVDLYDVELKKHLRSIRLSGWPESIVFRNQGDLLAVSSDNESLFLLRKSDFAEVATLQAPVGELTFSTDGNILILMPEDESDERVWRIHQTVGYHEWVNSVMRAEFVTVFGGSVSQDDRFLMLTSTAGVEVWDVELRSRVAFYAVENQRIDARTDAWWLPGSSKVMLVQVPGALEKIWLADDGTILKKETLNKVPGSKILNIREDGSWLVELLDDSDQTSIELWPNGDERLAEDSLIREESLSHSEVNMKILENGKIELTGKHTLTLTSPDEKDKVQTVIFSQDGNQLYGLYRSNKIFEWGLLDLEADLESRGF